MHKITHPNIHALATILLALFFFNAGVKKFIPKPPRPSDNTELIKSVTDGTFESPSSFMLTIKSMKASGFLYMVGVFQILAALLMLFPKTRLIGLLILLPVIANIFFLHVFMDNRMGENVETGLLLALNLLLVSFYYEKVLGLAGKRIKD